MMTRGRRHYRYLTRHIDGWLPTGFPCTADRLIAEMGSYISHGPRLLAGTVDKQTFFDFLRSWGGEWMWTNIDNDGTTLDWVVSALSEGTTIWITDGSYNKDIAPSAGQVRSFIARPLGSDFMEIFTNSLRRRGRIGANCWDCWPYMFWQPPSNRSLISTSGRSSDMLRQ